MTNRTMPYTNLGRGREFKGKLPKGINYDEHPVFGGRPRWRRTLHRIIFGNETKGGRAFDIVLIISIFLSVTVVMLESVTAINQNIGPRLRFFEWVLTLGFTLEYVLRLLSAERPTRYARTVLGMVDLLAILPTYISLMVPGAQAGAVLRVLRILRIFRVLKLAQFIGGERMLIKALRSSAHKIVVFLIAVLTAVIIFGSAMYFIEGADSGFTSIPRSVYWAIVTLTTVGFGDIAPLTPVGQIVAVMIMVLGYGIIAVPTGIVTAGLVETTRTGETAPARSVTRRTCDTCEKGGHSRDARFCCYCSMELPL